MVNNRIAIVANHEYFDKENLTNLTNEKSIEKLKHKTFWCIVRKVNCILQI